MGTNGNTKELIKDLCSRLPYGVKCSFGVDDAIYEVCSINPTCCGASEIQATHVKSGINGDFTLNACKPYLFPLSSLTEEQRNDISKLLIDTQNTFSPYGEINTKGCDNLFVCSVKQSNALINYCLMHHLDINGLIEKGLAIDATGLNIY